MPTQFAGLRPCLVAIPDRAKIAAKVPCGNSKERPVPIFTVECGAIQIIYLVAAYKS